MGFFYLAGLLVKTVQRWIKDEAFTRSAALAYYALFSMAPMLIVITVLVGLVYSGNTIEQVRSQFANIVSPEAADLIATGVMYSASNFNGSIGYTAFALALMLIGASAFTFQLKSAVEGMWNVQTKPDRGFCATVKCRLSTLAVVFAAGVLLQASVVVSSAISVYRRYSNAVLPGVDFIWHWIDHGISFVVVASIFGVVYKLLPNARIGWPDVCAGSILTGLLFTFGKWGFALYLSTNGFQSIYGAAGSLMILLTWLYYTSLILLFGAEFTQVWVESRGRHILPRDAAA